MTLIDEAVAAWGQSNEARWRFAQKAHEAGAGENLRGVTKELAALIQRSDDTVLRYVAAYSLYLSVPSARMRKSLEIGHWCAAGMKVRSGVISFELAEEYLQEAEREGWTVEQTRAALPHADTHEDFYKSARRLADQLDRFVIHAPRGRDDEAAQRVSDAARFFVDAVEDMEQAERVKG